MLGRLSLAAALAVAATAGAQAHPHHEGDGQTASSWARVKVSSCSRSEHNASFYARMKRLAPGQRMWMRFTLLERGRDGRYRRVDAPALERWRKSKPAVATFGYKQRVRGLSSDSAYRVRVDFRWYAADGVLERRAHRRSGVCSQTGPVPNLRARIVGSGPSTLAGLTRYTVRVANAGARTAEQLGVRLTVEGSGAQQRAVARLGPGEAALVRFDAAGCTSAVTSEADPDDEVLESSETDNAQRLACSDLPPG
jgi:hypothetical protein